jgi:hypothetical protein
MAEKAETETPKPFFDQVADVEAIVAEANAPATEAPDPEAARAIYDAALEQIEQDRVAKIEKERKAKADAADAEFAARLKAQRKELRQRAAAAEPKAAEQAQKEASVPGSDPRDSVFDAAPGKSLDDVFKRNAALAAGKFTDTPAEPQPAQWFVVTDEADLLEVARKLGLPDHSELGAINGRYGSNYGVQRGERVILPAHYRFTEIENVITEGDEALELAGSEATA